MMQIEPVCLAECLAPGSRRSAGIVGGNFALGGSNARIYSRLSAFVLFVVVCCIATAAQGTPPTTGLRLWVAADTGVTVDGNGGVSSWVDQSGNGNDAVQATASSRPTVVLNEWNGKPVVRFNGSIPQFFTLPNLLNGATAGEVLVVVKAAAATGNNSGLWYFGTNPWDWYPLADGLLYNGFGTNVQKAEGTPAHQVVQPHIYNVSSQANLWQSWLDGITLARSTSNTVAFNTTPFLGRNGGGYGFHGDIAEMLIYDRVLSAGERLAASSYLAQKYAIVASPEVPQLTLAAKMGATQAVVSWKNSALTGAPTEYTIERKDGSAGTYAPVATVSNETSFIDANLITGVQYSYRLRASNWVGQSGYSNSMDLVDPGTGASLFPTSGIRLWLTAESPGVSPIGLWEDVSGLGNDAVQATAGNRPTVVLGALNGKPVVRFNGSNVQHFTLPNLLSGASAAEVLVVLKAAAATGNNSGLWYFGTNPWDWYPLANGMFYNSFGSNSPQIEGQPSQDFTQYHIYNVSSQAGRWESWLNGVPLYRSTSNTVAFNTTPFLGRNGGGYGFHGDIAEMLIYDRVLTEAEKYSASAYLSQKYGLVSVPSIPSSLSVTPINSTENLVFWNGPLGGGFYQYVVERATTIGGAYTQIGTVKGGRIFRDTTAVAGQQYFYRVFAQNVGGSSLATDPVAVTTRSDGFNLPTDGMRLWLMADGTWETPLGFWHDYSGFGNDAWQNSYANRPAVVSSALNGRPVVRFNGAGQFLVLPDAMNGASAGEIFVVAKSTSTSGAALMQFGSNPYTYGSVYPWADGKVYDDFGSTAQQVVGNVAPPLNQPHIYNITAQAGSWVARVNGLEQYRNFSNTVSFTAAPRLGTRLFQDIFFSGDIAEVIVYNRALSEEERIAVEYYLGGKYGLAATLPDAPTELTAVPLSPTQVSLAWNSIPNNASLRYVIERKVESGSYVEIGVLDNSASFIDTTVAENTHYTYRLRALNYAGLSTYSNAATVTTVGVGNALPLTGIRLWLKADAGAKSPVAIWQDQSDLGNTAQQPIAVGQPSVVAGAINGHPVVRFNGAGQFLNLPNLMNGAGAGEIFVVNRAESATTTTGRALMQFGSSAFTFGAVYPWTDGKIYDDFGSTAQQVVGVASAIAEPNIYNVSSQPGLWVARSNGTELYRNKVNTVSFSTGPVLGTRLLKDLTFAGDVAELIVYDHVLSSSERAGVENYLDRKYLPPSMDADEDGLTNGQEITAGTDPLNWDTNGDGIPDGVDVALGFDPLELDLDHDGLSNAHELALGTSPFQADTDGDGVADGADAFPLDPGRWTLAGAPGDSNPPVITLIEPVGAVAIP